MKFILIIVIIVIIIAYYLITKKEKFYGKTCRWGESYHQHTDGCCQWLTWPVVCPTGTDGCENKCKCKDAMGTHYTPRRRGKTCRDYDGKWM